ncbi:MAG: PKD domain-containing protein [Bacteroidetes bacterium]|nr:PKD domain-containing protein [Bacteroidota bacterium]
MQKKYPFVFFLCVFFIAAQAHDDKRVVTPHVNPSLRFTENAGQWENNILFRAQLDGGALYVEKNCLTFSFYDKKKYRAIHHGAFVRGEVRDLNIQFHAYKMHFENCNPNAGIEKMQQGSDYENFFLGNDKSKWKGDVKNYHQIWLRELYNGIDYEAITSARGMKYNFHVKPNADITQIKLRYEGINNIKLKDGKLILKPEVNEVIEHKPYAYQTIDGTITEVPCEYKLSKNVVTFHFPKGYNKNYDLVIDPLLVFAAQSGSTADNFGMTATFDPQGNLYAGGTVFGNGYPTTVGAFQSSFSGMPSGFSLTDVVVTKYNSTGTALIYSTYLGGTASEVITSTIVDSNGNLCLYGTTSSTNFPVTQGAYDTSFNGGQQINFFSNGTHFENGTDIYIAKFNSTGTNLLACTYLGGSGNDGINHVNHLTPLWWNPNISEYATDSLQYNYGDQYRGEIQLDNANNIYVVSSTRSSNFPIVGGFDNTLGGKQDAIIAKFNSNLTALIYSSYVGGNSNDAGYGLIVKDNHEVYMTGGTCSGAGFPGSGGYQPNYQGGIADGFVLRIRNDGSVVMNRTFFGTSQYDQSYFIQEGKYDDIYIYGQSLGNTPVVTASNAATVYSVANTHQFIARFDETLGFLTLATKFGSSTSHMDISPCAFAVDKCNNIYLSGWGGDLVGGTYATTGMPLFQATQSTTDGFDFYFMGLDSNATNLMYGSYFGGALSHEHVDGGTSRFDASGKIYQSACAGCANNDDWPVTPGAWPNTPGNPNHSSNCNNGVVKLDFQLQMTVAYITTNTLSGCAPLTTTFVNTVPSLNPGSTYTWYLGAGNTTTTNPSPVVTFNNPGSYTIALVINDNLTCNKKDSAVSIVTIYPKPTANFLVNASPSGSCSTIISFNQSSSGSFGSSPYLWNFGNGVTSTVSAPSYTYPSTGNYTVSLTVTDINGCVATKTVPVGVQNFTPGIVQSGTLCNGASTVISASGGSNYTWTPSNSLNSSFTPSPVANPSVTTIYSVEINEAGCAKTLTTQILVIPKPSTNFSFSGGHCTNQIQTNNLSSGSLPSNPFIWNFGNGVTSTEHSPLYTYPDNGTYTITLTATDINGCTDIKTHTVSVFNFTPGVVSDASLCTGSSTVIVADGGTDYTWTPASFLNDNTVSSPIANPNVTTVYSVNIVNTLPTGYACAKTLTTEVVVRPTPVTAFSYSMNFCGGGVWFTDQSSDDVSAWQWTLTPTATSTNQNAYYFYHQGGTFTVSLVSANEYLCKSSRDTVIDVGVPPEVSASSSVNICKGDSVQLNASGGISYEWTPPQTLDFPTLANPIAIPPVTTEYSVDIVTNKTNTVNGKPCVMMLTSYVEVTELSTIPIKATANPVMITIGEHSTLIYLGSPGALVTWLPKGSTSPEFGYTVTASPDRPTTYTAVASKGPCVEDTKVAVDAYSAGCIDNDVFIPNTFTPNGDGKNDVLFVRGVKVDEVYFAIYNRWGELVFETNDKTKGWDGTYKGKAADVGVFGYYLKVKCITGAEAFKKGNVTLLR